MTEPAAAVLALLRARQQARAEGDFATADALRDEIRTAGWLIIDSPTGPSLHPAPSWPTYPGLAEVLAAARANHHRPAVGVVVDIIVDGWPADITDCVTALLAHAPADIRIHLLDLGDVDGAGAAAADCAAGHPDRVVVTHVATTLRQVGWSAAIMTMLTCDETPRHVLIEPSTILTGDALTPLVDALDDPGVAAAGWRGVMVDRADNWRSVHEAPPGEVDALLGYLLIVDRQAALTSPVHPAAQFYRNADLEWSLALRAAGGRLIALGDALPVRQGRHRGYHDTDPAYRDAQSRRTYDRLLRRFRGRDEILVPRAG